MILNVLRYEPARVVALVLATIATAAAFGLGITSAQQAAVVALVGAVLALVGGEAVRAQVSPVAKIPSRSNAPTTHPPAKKAPAKKAAAKRPAAKKAAPKPRAR